MNSLRISSVAAGITLLLFATWGTIHYQNGALTLPFLGAFVLGVVCVFIRPAAQHWQLWRRRRKQRTAPRETQAGQTFVSETSIDDKDSLLQSIRSNLGETEEFEARIEEFPEGQGLTVVHSGFHNAFLRVTKAGSLVITGGTEMTPKLAEKVADITGVNFIRKSVNPMLRKHPVRGKTRLVIWILLCVFFFTGITMGTTGAYPADTYNSAERTVLVSMDARGAADPTTSSVETQLSKAAFLVSIMEEESIEIYWSGNDSQRIITHAEQSTRISADARGMIADARASNPERAEQLSGRLQTAKMNVSTALCAAIQKNQTNQTVDARLNELRGELLRSSSNSTVTQCPRNATASSLAARSHS